MNIINIFISSFENFHILRLPQPQNVHIQSSHVPLSLIMKFYALVWMDSHEKES